MADIFVLLLCKIKLAIRYRKCYNITMKKYQILNGSILKLIAMLTMLIDHMGAVIFYMFTSAFRGEELFAGANTLYAVTRAIGRTSFPIFCFLLVEGFCHTRNVYRYMSRLLLFACLSEIPFNLAVYDSVFQFKKQNVFWSLLLGVVMLGAIEKIKQSEKIEPEWKEMSSFVPLIAVGIASYLLHTDYDIKGIILIYIFYMLRFDRILSCVAGYISFLWEAKCFPAFLLIPLYNGERGKQLKYLFYVFYPIHLLLLYAIKKYILQGV